VYKEFKVDKVLMVFKALKVFRVSLAHRVYKGAKVLMVFKVLKASKV
jgi:hypothetical protein